MPDQMCEAVDQALAVAGLAMWGEARSSLFGGSTRRTAEAAGVSPRSVQRWIAAEEEGRASQTRRLATARLIQVSRRAMLERIRDGAPVSYSFVGDIEARSGGHRGRRGRVRVQSRDTGGFAGMSLGAVADRLAAAMFGGVTKPGGS